MDNRLKAAFDEIHAEEELKNRTRAFLAEKRRKKSSLAGWNRRLAPALACVLVLLMGWGGFRLFLTPTAVISIDVNPSLELGINRFQRVVSVTGYNEDGQGLADSLDLNFLTYTEAVEQLLASQQLEEYLSQDAVVSIAVAGADDAETQQMLTQIQSCTEQQENTHCYSSNMEEVSSAHEAGLSCGKYRAYLQLQALDPEITVDEVRNMSMREIRDLIASLSGTDSSQVQVSDAYGEEEHEHSGNGSGNGNGWGHGHEQEHGHWE